MADKEAIRREASTTLKWYIKHINLIREQASMKSDKVSRQTVQFVDQFIQETTMCAVKENKKPKPVYVLEKYDSFDIMRPVATEETELLTKNAIGDGRLKYLKKRFKINPEDKFYFPECTNWTYGWQLKKAAPSEIKRAPRVEVVKRSFYRKSGVGRDPNNYKEPATGTKPSVCNH